MSAIGLIIIGLMFTAGVLIDEAPDVFDEIVEILLGGAK